MGLMWETAQQPRLCIRRIQRYQRLPDRLCQDHFGAWMQGSSICKRKDFVVAWLPLRLLVWDKGGHFEQSSGGKWEPKHVFILCKLEMAASNCFFLLMADQGILLQLQLVINLARACGDSKHDTCSAQQSSNEKGWDASNAISRVYMDGYCHLGYVAYGACTHTKDQINQVVGKNAWCRVDLGQSISVESNSRDTWT